jgi:hypothetical protein
MGRFDPPFAILLAGFIVSFFYHQKPSKTVKNCQNQWFTPKAQKSAPTGWFLLRARRGNCLSINCFLLGRVVAVRKYPSPRRRSLRRRWGENSPRKISRIDPLNQRRVISSERWARFSLSALALGYREANGEWCQAEVRPGVRCFIPRFILVFDVGHRARQDAGRVSPCWLYGHLK